MKFLLLAVCVAFVAASPNRERRDACVDAFLNVPNPCNNNNHNVFFPHPRDPTKFLQCNVFGKMLIIQCPVGEQYNAATTTCAKPPPATAAPATNLNPCTPASMAGGKIYYVVPNDNTRFIECDQNGNANILTCPSNLVWDENRLSCVYATSLTGTVVGTPSPVVLPATGNPCTNQAANPAGQFFSHPDSHKFIQCDIAGDAYVLTCPAGLIWNQFSKTCVSPYLIQQGTVVANGIGK